MNKVLIISYYWPPSGGAGVQRWLKFVKYLPSFNWQPHVYTALNGEMPVIDTSLEKDIPSEAVIIKKPIWEPYAIYKRINGKKKSEKINAAFLNEGKKKGLFQNLSVWIRGNFFIPDARRFWINPSVKFLNAYIKEQNIKYIISSGPPHSMHVIALKLKQQNPHLKWIADFRDPWTNIDFYNQLMLSKSADKKHHTLEKSVINTADSVISVGRFMSEEFAQMHIQCGGKNAAKFKVITNGFDRDDLPKLQATKDEKFSIAHIGTLVKDRNPDVLWKVLSKLTQENSEFEKQLEIKLVGKVDAFVLQELTKYKLEKYIKKIDYLPHNEVIIEQQKSKVLLLLVNNTPNSKGILTGKIFEYMMAGSPILAIGPEDGDLADLLNETKAGKICGFNNIQQLENSVLNLFQQSTSISSNSVIEKYSRQSLTKELVQIMEEL